MLLSWVPKAQLSISKERWKLSKIKVKASAPNRMAIIASELNIHNLLLFQHTTGGHTRQRSTPETLGFQDDNITSSGLKRNNSDVQAKESVRQKLRRGAESRQTSKKTPDLDALGRVRDSLVVSVISLGLCLMWLIDDPSTCLIWSPLPVCMTPACV